MPETLYSLGKAAWHEADASAAEKSWLELLSIEKQGEFAAQTHFALAGLYRKQGKMPEAEQEDEGVPKTEEQRLGAKCARPAGIGFEVARFAETIKNLPAGDSQQAPTFDL